MGTTLVAAARRTPVGAFAAVMATAIVSTASDRAHLHLVAVLLTAIAAAVYVTLVLLVGVRIAAARDGLRAEWEEPRRAVGALTFVAGSTVLGERLDELHVAIPALVLVTAGVIAWLVLGYAVVLRAIVAPDKRRVARTLDGGWLLWVVATQSVATAAAMVAVHQPHLTSPAAAVAVAAWSAGAVLYLLLFAILLARLLLVPIDPADLEPNWWIAMGATAISVLAGARILNLPDHGVTMLVRPAVGGISFMLWAFGTWLIPVLVALGVWRHGVRRAPLRYGAGLWSMVFPLGMYASATAELGGVAGLPLLSGIGFGMAYVALAAWVAVAAGFVAAVVTVRSAGARAAGVRRADAR